jgi:hypothetical protein
MKNQGFQNGLVKRLVKQLIRLVEALKCLLGHPGAKGEADFMRNGLNLAGSPKSHKTFWGYFNLIAMPLACMVNLIYLNK